MSTFSSSVSSSFNTNSLSSQNLEVYNAELELQELETEKMMFSLYFEQCLTSTSIEIQCIEEITLAEITKKHRMLKRKQRKSMRKSNNVCRKCRKYDNGNQFRQMNLFSEFKYSSFTDSSSYCVDDENKSQIDVEQIWRPIPIIQPSSKIIILSSSDTSLLHHQSNLNNINNNNNNNNDNNNIENNRINESNRQFEANDPNQQCQRATEQ